MNAAARIARKNARITIQKNTVTADRYKNRLQEWTDHFSCSAYAGTYADAENGSEVISEDRRVTFEARWCPELSGITSTGYRVIFNGSPYNILSVDMMNYQKGSIRLICRKEKR